MAFLQLIIGNVLRQKIRTGLTVLGMSVGIVAVVAFGVITESALNATAELLTAGGSDFAIGRSGSADLTLSILTEEDLEDVRAYDDVASVTPMLLAFARVGSNPLFAIAGIDPADLVESRFDINIVEGRRPEAGTNEIMLGRRAANDQGVGIGETLEIEERGSFRVVGIYDIGTTFLNGGGILPLDTAQEVERKPGLYTLFFVRAEPGVDVKALGDRIERENRGLATLLETEDASEVDQGLEILDALNLGITILAVFIGGIAVMNTMVMAVFERTREFGILRAVGWRTRRVLAMVLGESLVLCLIAVVFGSLVAVGVTRLILLVPAISAFIVPVYTIDVFIRGLLVGLGVALLGALYPAYRAASFSPAQAIRYE